MSSKEYLPAVGSQAFLWLAGPRGRTLPEGRSDGTILVLTWASEKKMYILQWVMKASIASIFFLAC